MNMIVTGFTYLVNMIVHTWSLMSIMAPKFLAFEEGSIL